MALEQRAAAHARARERRRHELQGPLRVRERLGRPNRPRHREGGCAAGDRTPTDIQQVGYYIPANGSTWAAYWSPTDPNGEIVYTADAYRGVDVLKIDSGGTTGKRVKAPVRSEWFGTQASDTSSFSSSFQSHPTFGFICPVLKADVDSP